MNSINILGRISTDLTLRYTNEGHAICNFNIAYNHTKDKASFFSVVVYGKGAEHVNSYFRKGSRIAINGVLRQDSYTNQKGENVSRVVIVAHSVYFVDTKAEANASASANASNQTQAPTPPAQASANADYVIELDSIPF